jgi:hypothetical protein
MTIKVFTKTKDYLFNYENDTLSSVIALGEVKKLREGKVKGLYLETDKDITYIKTTEIISVEVDN